MRSLSTRPTPVSVPPVPTPETRMSSLAVGVAPDLLGGRPPVDGRVGRILELLRDEVAAVVRLPSRSTCAMAPFMPSAPGVRISSAPKARSSLRRSWLTVSGMIRVQR